MFATRIERVQSPTGKSSASAGSAEGVPGVGGTVVAGIVGLGSVAVVAIAVAPGTGPATSPIRAAGSDGALPQALKMTANPTATARRLRPVTLFL
jgi:hypothetical protein